MTLPSGIDGGYLLELDTYDDYHAKQVSDFETSGKQPIQFKSPEYAVTSPEMYNYAKDYIRSFENAVSADDYYAEYDGKQQHYSDLFDIKHSFAKNTDWYSFAMFTASFEFGKRCIKCNYIE